MAKKRLTVYGSQSASWLPADWKPREKPNPQPAPTGVVIGNTVVVMTPTGLITASLEDNEVVIRQS